MSRTARLAAGGMVFHVLNRGVGRKTLFATTADVDAFERVLTRSCAARCGCWPAA